MYKNKIVHVFTIFSLLMLTTFNSMRASEEKVGAQTVPAPLSLTKRVSKLKDDLQKEPKWLQEKKYRECVSRRMVMATCGLLALGSLPFICHNVSSPQPRLIESLVPFISQPLVKYSLFAVGWLGSAMAFRYLFPYPSRRALDKRLGKFQKDYVEPLVTEVTEIGVQVETQAKVIDDSAQETAILKNTIIDLEQRLKSAKSRCRTIDRTIGDLALDMNTVKEQGRAMQEDIEVLKTPVSGPRPLSTRSLSGETPKPGRNPLSVRGSRSHEDVVRERDDWRGVSTVFSEVSLQPSSAVKEALAPLDVSKSSDEPDLDFSASIVMISPEKESKQEAALVTFQPRGVVHNDKDSVVLQRENDTFIKELEGLTKYEQDQFSGSDTEESRPASPSAIMYRKMIGHLRKINEILQKPAKEDDPKQQV